jgi:hypothetical protein
MRDAETTLAIIRERGKTRTRPRIDHWRAGCSETCKSGSEGGGWKRTQPVARHCRRKRAHEPRHKPYLASRLPYGYHPLVVSLANTSEPLFLVNRSGNRPSHEHADVYLDKAAALCRRAGFKKITYRGDTDFTQTKRLDRWDQDGVRFIFGIDAMANLKALAERVPDLEYSELERPPGYTIKTAPRQARERHKERIVAEREFDTLKLIGEGVAEFEYQPVACKKAYRVVVLRKKLIVEKGQLWLFEPDRYFFYITNDRTTPDWRQLKFPADDHYFSRTHQPVVILPDRALGGLSWPVRLGSSARSTPGSRNGERDDRSLLPSSSRP